VLSDDTAMETRGSGIEELGRTEDDGAVEPGDPGL
jgi:hypothetical protein